MVFCTTLLWGAMSPLAKLISAGGLNQLSVMSYRSVVVCLFMGIMLFRRDGAEAFRVSRKMLAAYIALGLFTVVFNASGFMMSCTYLSVPQALIIHYTFPLVTMVGEAAITRERPTPLQVAAGFLIIAGLYIGFGADMSKFADVSLPGAAWGALSVTGLAGQTLLSRKLSKDGLSDALRQLFASYFFGGITIIVCKSVFYGWGDLDALTPGVFLLVQYPAFVAGLFGFGLLFTALKYIPASTSSLICSLEIVFALLLTPLLLHQMPTAYELAGCAIIIAAVVSSVSGRAKG